MDTDNTDRYVKHRMAGLASAEARYHRQQRTEKILYIAVILVLGAVGIAVYLLLSGKGPLAGG